MTRRLLPAALLAAAVLGLALLWRGGAQPAFIAVFDVLGIDAEPFPFLDTHAILAAIQCRRAGIDVFVTNPCDALGRLHVYSPLWLALGVLPITTGWTVPVGLALVLLFIASLPLLPPPRGWGGTLILGAAMLSSAVAYALERGNNDLLIFVLAVLAGRAALGAPWLRRLGHAATVTAAALKYYPITLLILAWRERWPRALLIGLAALVALAAALFPARADLLRALHLVPAGTRDSFGAANIPLVYAARFGWPPWSRTLLELALILWMAARALGWSRRLRPALGRLSDPERVFLTVGAVLMVGCFLAGQSIGYRAIHLLFVLPALLALATPLARLATALVLLLLWGDAWRIDGGPFESWLWLLQQSAWWLLVTILLALLSAMLPDTELVASIRASRAHRAAHG